MAMYELDGNHLIPVRLGRSADAEIQARSLAAVQRQVIEVLRRPLFPLEWGKVAGGESLTALDATGQVVLVEVLDTLGAARIMAAMARLTATAALGRRELAGRYANGLDSFREDWNEFREAMPTQAEPGPRLTLIAASLAPEVRPSLSVLLGAGVELYEVDVRVVDEARVVVMVEQIVDATLGAEGPLLVARAPRPSLTGSGTHSAETTPKPKIDPVTGPIEIVMSRSARESGGAAKAAGRSSGGAGGAGGAESVGGAGAARQSRPEAPVSTPREATRRVSGSGRRAHAAASVAASTRRDAGLRRGIHASAPEQAPEKAPEQAQEQAQSQTSTSSAAARARGTARHTAATSAASASTSASRPARLAGGAGGALSAGVPAGEDPWSGRPAGVARSGSSRASRTSPASASHTSPVSAGRTSPASASRAAARSASHSAAASAGAGASSGAAATSDAASSTAARSADASPRAAGSTRAARLAGAQSTRSAATQEAHAAASTAAPANSIPANSAPAKPAEPNVNALAHNPAQDAADLAAIAAGFDTSQRIIWQGLRRGIYHEAFLSSTGVITLADGRTFTDPTQAANAAQGVSDADGWRVWRLGLRGPQLGELRDRL